MRRDWGMGVVVLAIGLGLGALGCQPETKPFPPAPPCSGAQCGQQGHVGGVGNNTGSAGGGNANAGGNGPSGCPSPFTECVAGTCVNLTTDSNNCGTCFNVCPLGMLCSNSTCN